MVFLVTCIKVSREKEEAYEAYGKYLAYEKRATNVTQAVAFATGNEDEAPVARRISIKTMSSSH